MYQIQHLTNYDSQHYSGRCVIKDTALCSMVEHIYSF